MADRAKPAATLITGASGIAAATARIFAAPAHRILMRDRDTPTLDAICAEIPSAIAFQADLCEHGAAAAAVAMALDHFGRLDVLVNVVGISGRRLGDGPVHECTDDGWRVVNETNLGT